MSEEKIPLSEKILNLWEIDSKIDRYSVSEESAKISSLHFKYLNFYRQVLSNIALLDVQIKALRLEKINFYSGKSDPNIYREKNFHLKVLKSDLDVYIDADEDYAKLILKRQGFENIKEILKSIIEQIKNRHWILRNIMEYDKFTSGG